MELVVGVILPSFRPFVPSLASLFCPPCHLMQLGDLGERCKLVKLPCG